MINLVLLSLYSCQSLSVMLWGLCFGIYCLLCLISAWFLLFVIGIHWPKEFKGLCHKWCPNLSPQSIYMWDYMPILVCFSREYVGNFVPSVIVCDGCFLLWHDSAYVTVSIWDFNIWRYFGVCVYYNRSLELNFKFDFWTYPAKSIINPSVWLCYWRSLYYLWLSTVLAIWTRRFYVLVAGLYVRFDAGCWGYVYIRVVCIRNSI